MKLFKSSTLKILDNSDFKVHWNADGNLVIPVKGFIFSKTPDDTDLEGDHFHTGTDLGPLEKVLSYFDHQMSDWYIPRRVDGVNIAGFGGKRIGYAEKMLTDEEKVIWDIIVDRRHEYINLVEELTMEKMLDASSLALYREDDPQVKGRINVWDTAAMDLTPTPAEPRAEAIVKHYLIDKFGSDIFKEERSMSKIEDNIKNAFKNADKPEEDQENVDPPVVEQEEQEIDVPNDEDIDSAVDLEDIKALLIGMNGRFDKIDSDNKKHADDIADIQQAFPILAEQTAKYVAKSVREVARQTSEEFDAESELYRRQVASKKNAKPEKGKSIYADKMNFGGVR